MNKVFAGAGKACASKRMKPNSRCSAGSWGHANPDGINRLAAGGPGPRARPVAKSQLPVRLKIAPENAACEGPKYTCDKASPARAVMLHLRACYVSKAAILTIPAHFVPVENRSPA
jgi:hypothetical protein